MGQGTLNLRADSNGQPVELSGKVGLIRRLFAHERFPLKLSGRLANAAVKINGAIDDILNLQGIDSAKAISLNEFSDDPLPFDLLKKVDADIVLKARNIHAKEADQIKCAVVQFDIKQGIADSQAFVFNTRAGILAGEGEIDLDTEQINFLLVPKSEHPSLSLSTKLKVSGTIMDPKVSPDKLSVLTKGAEALGSLAVRPIGLLAPFAHLGANKKHPCDIRSIGQLGLQSPASK